MHLLGCLLGLFLGILLLVLNLGFRLWWNVRKILKGGTGSPNPFGQNGPFRSDGSQGPQGGGNRQQSQSHTTTGRTSGNSHSKVFADNEGEYVEFEEIKE